MARKATRREQTRRCIGYVRVSTEDQASSGYGLDAQRTAITAYCQQQQLELVDILSDDGISGTKDAAHRPGLASVLAMVASGAVDGVVVKSLDRIGRSLAVIGTTLQTLQDSGAIFHSTQEPALTSPLVVSVYAGLASEERYRIVQRTASGRVAKASAGGVVGKPAYGYQIIGTRRDARLAVNEDQAATVRDIFAQRVAGATVPAIVASLNQRGIPSPSGKAWQASTIYKMLASTAYTGSRTWTESDQTFVLSNPVIIDEATFRAAQGGK